MTRYPHWGNHSGLRQYLKHLDSDELEVAVQLASDGDDDFPLRNPRVREAVHRYVQSGGMEWYKLSDLVAETKTLFRCLRRNVDIVHYLDAEHGAQYLPLLKRAVRTLLVGTYHQPSSLLPSLLRPSVVRRFDHVTLLSPEQMPFFEELLPRGRISMILHGVDTDFFRPGEASRFGREFVCLMVGHWMRDYEAFRRVAERLKGTPGVVFRVVSPRVERLEAFGNVQVLSNVTDEELRDLYQAADVLFLPLTDCTANNALLEGIACGLPVVSSDLASVRAYLPGDEGILVRNNDEALLTEALLRLRDDREMRQRMSIAARKRAQELSWPRVAKEYQSLYRALHHGSA